MTTVTRLSSVTVCRISSSCFSTQDSLVRPSTQPTEVCSLEKPSWHSASSSKAPWAEPGRCTPFMNLPCGNRCTQTVASQRSPRRSLYISWKPGWEPLWLQIHLVHLLASNLGRNWLGLTKVFFYNIFCLILNWPNRKPTVFWCINVQMSASLYSRTCL